MPIADVEGNATAAIYGAELGTYRLDYDSSEAREEC